MARPGSLAVIALTVLVAGCAVAAGSPGEDVAAPTTGSAAEASPTPPPSPTPIAWLDVPVTLASPSPPPTVTPPPGMPACLATGLQALILGDGFAAGTTYFKLRLTDMAGTSCYLRGTPGAQVLDPAGRVVLDGTKATGSIPGAPSIGPSDPVVGLAPGASAGISVGWSDWCGPDIKGPFTFALVLPADGGRLVAAWAAKTEPMTAAPGCMGGSISEVFASGPIEPPTTGAATPEPTLVPLHVEIGGLPAAAVAAGTVLDYTVTVSNDGGAPFDLRTLGTGGGCPDYEELFVGRPPEAFQLDCAAVPPIPTGGSVTFAMRIPTAGLATGDQTLAWGLAPERLGPATKTTVGIR